MKAWRHHRTAGACDELAAEPEWGVPLTADARACCCPARPAVTVVMPPTAGRPRPVDLLLCDHHFGVGQASLQAAGAVVYDKAGLLIMSGPGPAGALERQAGRRMRTAPGQRT